MSNKLKDILVSMLFFSITIGVFILNIIADDKEISYSERRKLKQFPSITKESILSGKLNDDIEEYAMDQFILRDTLRSIKTIVKLDLLKQKENNNLMIKDNNIYKTLYPLNEKSVLNITSKINTIYTKYLTDNTNIYYTIVPDKNYFLENDEIYLKLDYNNMVSIMKNNMNCNIKYIDIFDELSKDDYYSTDAHWKEESIIDVANKIASSMGIVDDINFRFDKKEYGEFYGAYYGQLGKTIDPDKIYYLTNDIIEDAITYNYENSKESKVYDVNKADNSMDKYDLFLSGPTPIIEIRNEKSTTNKQLIIFRDSFGSSIAPLFIEAYNKIVLIDTRYITTDLISNYIEFEDQDVLFIYSTLLINDSGSLK